MADDEDVIFENSPLYRHLSEVGFTDFHVETLNSCDERPKLVINEHLRQNNGENLGNRNLMERTINSAKRFISGYFLLSTVSEEISCYSSCVAMIKSSGLLADDDLELLYRFEQCTDTAYNNTDNIVSAKLKNEENNNKFTKANNSVLFNLATNRFMIGIVLLAAIILGLLLKTNSTEFKILSYTFVSILVIWLLLQLHFLQTKNKIYILKKNVALLLDYIKFTEKLLVLIRKVILFIQEKELVARGHIIVNPAAPITRLENRIRQCMMLRKCLSIEMNNYLGLLRDKIKDVSISKFPNTNHGNLNWLQKELSRIENECLAESEKNLQANEYSLMTLKKTFATLGTRQSSLLCCMAVNLMLVIIHLKQSGTKQDDSCQFYGCLEDLLDKGKKCSDNVSECYKFHKVDIPTHIFYEDQVRVSSDNTVYSPITLALRSMTLHLQQACKSSIEVEEKLDKLITQSTNLTACTDLDEINKQVLFIGQQIEKFNVCYEESQSRLEEIAFSSGEEQIVGNIVEEKANESSMRHEDRDVQILTFAEEAEPVPDQIFEGETTSDYDNETAQYSSNLGREELLREEKMREESRHLLKELKSVLATKDNEKMVAIPKVLLRKFGAVKSDDPVGNTGDSEEIEISKIETVNNVSSSAAESSQSEIKVKSMDKTRSLESYDGDSTVKEHAVSMLPVITSPPRNHQQSISGSDNAGNVTNDNSDVVHDLLNECNVNDHTEQISHANPFASMVAAAAAARNRQFGAMEESYEIEAETFGDENDTD